MCDKHQSGMPVSACVRCVEARGAARFHDSRVSKLPCCRELIINSRSESGQTPLVIPVIYSVFGLKHIQGYSDRLYGARAVSCFRCGRAAEKKKKKTNYQESRSTSTNLFNPERIVSVLSNMI